MTVPRCRDRLGALGTDIVFLQEVQHSHSLRASRFQHWAEPAATRIPRRPHLPRVRLRQALRHKTAATTATPSCRATRSMSGENEDISAHANESRGMLHCEIEVRGHRPSGARINEHLALNEGGRRRQLAQIAARVRKMVPDGAPLILAGDFNDGGWRVHLLQGGARAGRSGSRPTTASRPQLPVHPPMFQLDRIYVRGSASTRRTSTPATPGTAFRSRRARAPNCTCWMTARKRLRALFFRGVGCSR